MPPTLFHRPGSEPSMVPVIYRSRSNVLPSSLSTLVLRIWVGQPIGRTGRDRQYRGVKRTVPYGVGVGDAIRVSIKKGITRFARH
jgi:hypothetical protein